MKKLAACLLAILLLSCFTVCVAERNIFEYLALYQRSKDALKYEYEGFEDFEIEMSPSYNVLSSFTFLSYDHANLYLDSDMNINRGSFPFFDINGDDDENKDLIYEFVAAFCALEYEALYYSFHDLEYQYGLTENETVFDEALSVFMDSFDISEDALTAAMEGEDVFLYQGEHYSYYLCYMYLEANETHNNEAREHYCIRAVSNQ